jgi:hypothetical protein
MSEKLEAGGQQQEARYWGQRACPPQRLYKQRTTSQCEAAMPCHAVPCYATPYRFQLSAILNFLTNLSAVPPTLLAYGGGGERLEVDKNARGSRREGGNTCSSHCGKREEQEG